MKRKKDAEIAEKDRLAQEVALKQKQEEEQRRAAEEAARPEREKLERAEQRRKKIQENYVAQGLVSFIGVAVAYTVLFGPHFLEYGDLEAFDPNFVLLVVYPVLGASIAVQLYYVRLPRFTLIKSLLAAAVVAVVAIIAIAIVILILDIFIDPTANLQAVLVLSTLGLASVAGSILGGAV